MHWIWVSRILELELREESLYNLEGNAYDIAIMH